MREKAKKNPDRDAPTRAKTNSHKNKHEIKQNKRGSSMGDLFRNAQEHWNDLNRKKSDDGLSKAVGRVIGESPSKPAVNIVRMPLPFERVASGSKSWAEFIRDKVRASKLPDVAVRDAAKFTSNYSRLIREQRVEFWSHLIGITIKYECDYNPKSYSVDVGKPNDKDTWSVGLMQLSVCDQPNYGFKLGYSFADLQDPIKNLNLAILILEKVVSRDECIAIHDERWRGMSSYWGTLRDNESHKDSWRGITNYMLALQFPITTSEDAPRMPQVERKFKLAVVVGHERSAPGAQFSEPYSDTFEYDYNSEIAHLMFDYAHSLDIDCEIFLRDGIGISGAYKKARAAGADCCIELHCNAFNGDVKGSEVLCAKEDERFAETILASICEVFDRSQYGNRGVKITESGRGSESCVSFPGKANCLVEPAFCDESHDAKLLMTKKHEYARALVRSCIQYLEGT